MRKLCLLLPIVVLALFGFLRFRTLPETALVFGVLVNIYLGLFGVLLPWNARRKTKKDGPPLRFGVYLSVISFGALILGTILFIKFSEQPPLRAPLVGHTDQIKAIVYSPAAEKLASAGSDRVRLWKFVSEDRRFVLEREFPAANQTAYAAFPDHFTSIAYSPDGLFVLFGSTNGAIRIWDVRERLIVRQLTGHGGAVRALLFSPDGQWLASGSEDTTVRLWRVADWSAKSPLAAQADASISLAFSPDGSKLATTGSDKIIRVWRTSDSALLAQSLPLADPMVGVGFMPDGDSLLSITNKRLLRRWQISAPGQFQDWYLGQGVLLSTAINRAAFTTTLDGSLALFATGDADNVVRLWIMAAAPPRTWPTPVPPATTTPTPSIGSIGECRGHANAIVSLAFNSSATRLVSGSKDNSLKVWNVESRPGCSLVSTLQGHGTEITGGTFSRDGSSIASASLDKTIRTWNVADGRQVSVFEGAADEVTRLSFTPDLGYLVSASRDGYIRAWKTADGVMQYEFNWKPYLITTLAATNVPNSIVVAVGSQNGLLRLWRPGEGAPLEIQAHANVVSALAYRPDGNTLVTGSNNTLRFWRVADGARLSLWDSTSFTQTAELKGHNSRIAGLAFTPDGKTLASFGADRTIRLWKFADAQALTLTQSIALPQQESDIVGMTFSQDSKSLVTVGGEGIIRVWNLDDNTLLTEFPAGVQTPMALGINKEGYILAAGVLPPGRAIQEWTSANRLSEMRNRRSSYSITQFLIGNEVARVFVAAAVGVVSVGSFVLLLVLLSGVVAARTIYSQYEGFSFREAWGVVVGIELGLHKILQIVTEGEVQTTQPVGSLARFGGPGVLIVEEGHAAVLMASGRVTRVVGNGITWLKPFERVHMAIYLPVRVETVLAKRVVTHDKIELDSFELLVFHRPDRGDGSERSGGYTFDPKVILEKIWSPKGNDWREVVKSMSETTLRDVVAEFRLEDVVSIAGSARQDLIRELTHKLNQQTKGFLGVEVTGCNIGEIRISNAAKGALERKGLAEVERQTQVIGAEGEKEAAARKGEGQAIAIHRIQQEKALARQELLQQLVGAFRLMTEKIQGDPQFAQSYPDVVKSYIAAIERIVERIESLDKISTAEGPKTFIVGDTQGYGQPADLDHRSPGSTAPRQAAPFDQNPNGSANQGQPVPQMESATEPAIGEVVHDG